MKDKKIRLFLGGYVNHANAQNINCDHIAKYINKDRFEVHVVYTSSLPVDKELYNSKDICLHKVLNHRYTRFWTKIIIMVFGKYDIYYLPKTEKMDIWFINHHKRDKSVFIASVEGVVTETVNNSTAFRTYYTKLMDSSFAISKCISDSVKKYWDYDMPVLPLGVDPIDIHAEKKDRITSIIWVGNIKANKRPQYLVECAKVFPEISFTMVGDGDMQNEIIDLIQQYSLKNIRLTGRVPNSEVYNELQRHDLFLMTSEYEGLPKVTQEAAQCGLPSIYIGEQYDVDFIESGINGFKVMSLDEMKEKIQWLINHPSEYAEMSKKAQESVQEYLWPKLIKKYEEYFEKIYNEYCKRG